MSDDISATGELLTQRLGGCRGWFEKLWQLYPASGSGLPDHEIMVQTLAERFEEAKPEIRIRFLSLRCVPSSRT